MQGTLELPARVQLQNPRTELKEGEAHQYIMPIATESGSAMVTLSLVTRSADGDPGLFVFNSKDELVASVGGKNHAQLTEKLEDDTYSLVITGRPDDRYQLNASCDIACNPRESSLAFTREEPSSEDPAEIANDLNAKGTVLFRHVFNLRDGLGNGLGDMAPNMATVHKGAFGGPDAQSCISCHNQGGEDGAGGFDDNIFQGGDSQHESSALHRNPISLRGAGLRQAIAAQITADLALQRDQLLEDEMAGSLTIRSLDGDDIEFGTVSANGEVSGAGTDDDLVIEPFGWKGRDATVASFVTGGFRVHFGVQSEQAISEFCERVAAGMDDYELEVSENEWVDFGDRWGDHRSTCEDPDGDNVVEELLQTQLDAMSVYLQKLPLPAQSSQSGSEEGRRLMAEFGCTSCHVRGFALEASTFIDKATGAEIKLEEREEYEVWSDYKRHSMGSLRGDVREFPHDGAPGGAIDPMSMVTPPLWDLADSGPYWHDGTAPDLASAIEFHNDPKSEAYESAQKYMNATDAEREALLAFLGSLGARN